MEIEDVTVAYSGKPGGQGGLDAGAPGRDSRPDRPLGLRQDDAPSLLNRLTELTKTATLEGRITLDGSDIERMEPTSLRRRVTMVFQQPNPFPMSIFDNLAYVLREQGSRRGRKKQFEDQVGEALERAGLFEEVKDNLSHPALRLSGGQQQRLCIA